ncbi:MAG: tetratricopeptide repeat protein [Phycisphaerae bacterium]|nr:tetratricopeptide repeat protein [Phycisphaerae bacterium]
MRCLKMNKMQKIYIVAIGLFTLSSYTVAGDILDSYIGQLIAKSDSGDKESKLLDSLKSEAKPLSEKSDDKKAQPVKVADSKTGANSESTVKEQKTDIEKTSAETLDITKQLREKLQESSNSPLPDVDSSKIDEQLRDVLSQLKSLGFSEEDKTKDKKVEVQAESEVVAAETEPKAESVETIESVPSPNESEPNVTLPENDAEIIDMYELAESLFRIGDKENALKYYRKALDKSLPAGKSANPKRAWILFQIGNCLYNVDKVEAIKVYEQLILEHPSSDWTNCARTKKQILKWLLDEKPMTLTMSKVK